MNRHEKVGIALLIFGWGLILLLMYGSLSKRITEIQSTLKQPQQCKSNGIITDTTWNFKNADTCIMVMRGKTSKQITFYYDKK